MDPSVSCGNCDQCRLGQFNTCRKVRFLGCPGQLEGCLCDLIVMPEDCCYGARGLTADQAALVEPLSIGYYAVQLSGGLKGKKVGILGSGPIGLSVLLAARIAGASAIYVTDRLDYRLEAARRQGPAWTGNPDRTDIVLDIIQREPLELDAVFECCGQQTAFDQASEDAWSYRVRNLRQSRRLENCDPLKAVGALRAENRDPNASGAFAGNHAGSRSAPL